VTFFLALQDCLQETRTVLSTHELDTEQMTKTLMGIGESTVKSRSLRAL
jgi:hypothetical protein